MQAKRIQEFVRAATLDLGDFGELNVKYRPAAIGKDTLTPIQKAVRDRDDTAALDALANFLVSCVTEWDMEDEGEPLDITPELLESFGLEFCMLMATEIQGAVAVNPRKAASSNGRSGIAANSAASRTTTADSSSRNGPVSIRSV